MAELPSDYGQRISKYEQSGLRSWTDHVFVTANLVQSTLLYTQQDRQIRDFIEQLDPTQTVDVPAMNPEEITLFSAINGKFIRPECYRLYPDVFLASYEAIQIWIDPESRISVMTDLDSGELLKPKNLSPIVLPLQKLKPKWVNEQPGVLTLGHIKIKEIEKKGENIRPILDAFEAMGWPEEISDPLPNNQNLDQRSRLKDAVESLNSSHVTPNRFKFYTTHGYKAVTWKALDGTT